MAHYNQRLTLAVVARDMLLNHTPIALNSV